jgi:predicted acyltransferase
MGTTRSQPSRNLGFFSLGILAVLGGCFGGTLVPIEPHLWTVTFSLIAIGVGWVLLSFLHTTIDIPQWNAALSVCTVLGRNSLIVVLSTIGLLTALELAARFNDPGMRFPFNVASPACALLVLYLVTLLVFLLDRRQIYITV